ncbi:4-hydroxy-tetrahydrodipicolinate synthase [Domibacillus enclensis]|uniref:4-hydroxy-tetrahydrodipicolinate synthase n=1 Tax=Domibacillus enclensis TaxID=1017273 RepID=A0A1N6URK8_9BACI|nr:4-hydroxy-tetrahydrodipicolinate synthase [Domibacillus enclensis]OXS78599.1 4-hydroxy-tetrahydrodipicolinate synthase [Domibacillus enclensis]SIQ68111.1 4-hydroxy-tetrahydrodipicolinate synthase [Domibacillus enclensis]
MISFGRLSTAMVTPFDSKGNIDFNKTTQLIEHLIQTGTDSLVIAGTTGESPTLTSEEKVALFRHTVKVVGGRIPVIAGTGSNDTRASIELTKKAEAEGVDAIMLVAPYYNKPSQEGLFQHFKAIAEATKLPVMIYNIPGRTSILIDPKTTIRLANEVPNIMSTKEASGSIDIITEIVANTEDDFLVYSGDDGLTLPILSVGGTGIISVASHVAGNEMKEMVNAFLNGDVQKAAAIHQELLPLFRGLFAAPNPVPVKTALQMKGLDVGGVRLPLIPLTEEERTTLSTLL